MPDFGSHQFSDVAIREQIAKIVASPVFASSIRSRKFLEFIVDRTLAGTKDEIKEYTIAIEVLGRKDSYDSREHSAVRVEAARLRNRLKQYYEGSGGDDAIVIELPKGRYVPRFLEREALPAKTAPTTPERAPLWSGSWPLAGALAVPVVCLAIAAVWFYSKRAENPDHFRFRVLTETPGEEVSPSISSDGSVVIYSRRETGSWHIFELARNKKPLDLTPESRADNIQPAISPDGGSIAFRSSRDGGGIFLMTIAGGSLTRLSDFGYNPSWSPDGKKIVCASESVFRPEQRFGVKSSLWTLDVASRETRQIYAGDAVQPSWSPSGKRIAFWRLGEGLTRDILTVASDGSSPRAVTADLPLDWCPRWSPDGAYLYYLSDRDGSMNLWRVPVDESTGAPRGSPEPQTTPALDMSVFSIAESVPRLVYENRVITGRLVSKNLRTGEMRTIVTMPQSRQPAGPDLSPDGKWLTFYSIGKQEDIYVVGTDGNGLRQLTDDTVPDRGPRWSPDGETIAFKSIRAGRAEIWTIRRDGTGLKQITHTQGPEPIQPVWSPDGRRLAYSRTDGSSVILNLETQNDGETIPAHGFQVRSWSPDGRKIVGQTAFSENTAATIVEYDVATGRIRELGRGNQQTWDPDGKHILYTRGDTIWRLDLSTLKESPAMGLDGNLPIGLRLSHDESLIYVALTTIESNLWIREGK